MPVSLAHVKATEIGSGVVGTFSAGYSGLEVAGTIGGLLGSVVAVIALITSVTAGNAKRRRQYDDDIRAAETRGETRAQTVAEQMRREIADELTQARADANWYRERYTNLLEGRGLPATPPPPVSPPGS